MWVEQAQFDLWKLELEMQMKKLETKRPTFKIRALAGVQKKRKLHDKSFRSQSTFARDKSSFSWPQTGQTSRNARVGSTTFWQQIDQQLPLKQHLSSKRTVSSQDIEVNAIAHKELKTVTVPSELI